MKFSKKIKIGTRGSALALKQAEIVHNKLISLYPGIQTEIVTIVTSGDKILDKNLADIGGKGLFIKEIEEHLQEGRVDIAVHSLKDMPAVTHDIFSIPCVLERSDVRDAFISTKYKSLEDLPYAATLGTSSSRRAAQALSLRPDLKIVPLRGNINTRLAKIEGGIADGTFLAMAGVLRAGLYNDKIMHPIAVAKMLPAVSQGAIGIEILSDNKDMYNLLASLNHKPTFICTNAERSFMKVFEGSCTTPIAANAQIEGDNINLECLIAKPDGSVIHRKAASGNIRDAEKIGSDCAHYLKKLAGENFFA